MNDSWRKIVFNIDPDMSGDIPKILLFAKYCHEAENERKPFAVFRGMELPESEHRPTPIVYFSPIAATLCDSDVRRANLSMEDCDAPARDAPGLALLYSPDPEEAWGLLK